MEYLKNKILNKNMPFAVWTIVDMSFVIFIVLLLSISISIGMLTLFGDSAKSSLLSRYIIALVTLVIPILWVKSKYRLSWEALGLIKANLNIRSYALIVAIPGLYHFILWVVEARHISFRNITSLEILLLPLSMYSFSTIVLSPISEEIIWRGFVYGYLRKKFGGLFGLILQAMMFSFMHYNIYANISSNLFIIINVLIVGLLAGLIYEKTGSIYPAILFHCTFNYFSAINIAIQK